MHLQGGVGFEPFLILLHSTQSSDEGDRHAFSVLFWGPSGHSDGQVGL